MVLLITTPKCVQPLCNVEEQNSRTKWGEKQIAFLIEKTHTAST
jgi:hypothetical protein